MEEGEGETNEEVAGVNNELKDSSEVTSVDVEAEAWIGSGCGCVLFEDGEVGSGMGEEDEEDEVVS